MQIIIEYVLIENIIINFFILKVCEKFLKEKASLKFLNSLFGAIIAVCFPLFNLSAIGIILLKILVGSVMVCFSFKFKNLSQFFYKYFAFSLMTFVFGGAVEALSQATGDLSIVLILIFAFLLYFLFSHFLATYTKRKALKDFQYSVRLFYEGKEVDEMAYFDSGNILYDNITKKPIVLISPEVFEKLTGKNYFEFVLKESSTLMLKNCHYVPASTSMSQGKMLVFEVEKLQIIIKNQEVKEHKNIFLGLSFADFEKSFNSNLLLHSTLI